MVNPKGVKRNNAFRKSFSDCGSGASGIFHHQLVSQYNHSVVRMYPFNKLKPDTDCVRKSDLDRL